jgi:hypothetical protein
MRSFDFTNYDLYYLAISKDDQVGALAAELLSMRDNTLGTKQEDAFDRYEQLPASYHSDPRWQVVQMLRKQGAQAEANGLVFQIREDYGFDG